MVDVSQTTMIAIIVIIIIIFLDYVPIVSQVKHTESVPFIPSDQKYFQWEIGY